MPRIRAKQTRTSRASKSKKFKSTDDGLYTIKGILDERVVKVAVKERGKGTEKIEDQIQYLVDWEDHKVTGEKYPPNWTPRDWVTDQAIQEWEGKKSGAKQHEQGGDGERQFPRPAHQGGTRQRKALATSRPASLSSLVSDLDDRPRKLPRHTFSSTSPSEARTPSVDWQTASDDVPWSPSCLTQRDLDAPRSQKLVVGLPGASGIDTSTYLSAQNTQQSGGSSQSLSALEDEDQRMVFASQLSQRATIPDSQEPSGESWPSLGSETAVFVPATSPTHQDPVASISSVSPIAKSNIQNNQIAKVKARSEYHSSEEKRDKLASHSNGADIPSHQVGRPGSYVDSPGIILTAPATKPNSEPDEPQRNSSGPASGTTTSPVFFSQLQAPTAFNIPDSSGFSHVPESPIRETTQESVHNNSKSGSTTTPNPPPDSQDAQVGHIDPFVSHVGAFTESHNSASQSSAPGPSAVDELSQIFSLDSEMAEEALAAPEPKTPAVGHEAGGLSYEPEPPGPPTAEGGSSEPAEVPVESHSETLLPSLLEDSANATVSLADISKDSGPDDSSLPLMPSLMPALESSEALESSAFPLAQQHEAQDDANGSESSQELEMPSRHIITLPFQASLRPLYDDTLLESKRDVTRFGAVFNSETYETPDEALVQKIDTLFNRLHNICDYPPDVAGGVLEDLPSKELIKYCCDASPKINFVFELLQGLTKEKRILIVARSVELLRLLYRVTEVLEIECVCNNLGKARQYSSSVARVTLVLPETEVSEDFDVVIGYDHTFSGSVINKRLMELDLKTPLVLILVTTHSIEHIDLFVPPDLSILERKNTLMSGIVRSRQLVADPDRGYPEPHELAGLFLDYLNGHVEAVIWEPSTIPDEVLDVFLSSQAQTQTQPQAANEAADTGRKRKLGDSDDEDVKRMRLLPQRESTVQINEAPLTDDVRTLLQSVKVEDVAIKASQVEVKVPLAILQALAEQHAELKRQLSMADNEVEYQATISNLEARVKEYERTERRTYERYRSAIADRTKYEQEARAAEKDKESAIVSAKKDVERAQQKTASLEATMVRLTASPDGADEETPLAKTQALLEEAQAKVQTLEKRVVNAQNDGEYARTLYQEASTSASAMRVENDELKEQNRELAKKSEETLGRVHQIQADRTNKQYLRQIRELKALVREREIELDLTKEELRLLKNGRRETRGASVPRSPRMGMMSPRTGRAAYPPGGSASRGTSPAPTSAADGAAITLPGIQFMGQPPGNGRWNHLRD